MGRGHMHLASSVYQPPLPPSTHPLLQTHGASPARIVWTSHNIYVPMLRIVITRRMYTSGGTQCLLLRDLSPELRKVAKSAVCQTRVLGSPDKKGTLKSFALLFGQ
eukprot:4359164-Amphidinium_carterae.1